MPNTHERKNFFIITGGPGSGKSSIIESLKQKGYQTVEEVGREIIKQQHAIGGNALHWGDRLKFRELMLSRSIADFLQIEESEKSVFFDRGIPELIGYSYLIKEPVPVELWHAAEQFRYNSKVFIAPPWQEIYQKDAERKQDFQEAIETYTCVKKSYLECGYTVIELPKVDVDARVQFLLSNVI